MKFNRFYVVDGMLEVEQEVANKCDKDGIPAEDDDIGTHVERVLLNTGESLTIAPGVKHRFIVLSDALVVESVWAERITDDICRFNEGHVMEK
jgi:D-lyxose ketol-isomerase